MRKPHKVRFRIMLQKLLCRHIVGKDIGHAVLEAVAVLLGNGNDLIPSVPRLPDPEAPYLRRDATPDLP